MYFLYCPNNKSKISNETANVLYDLLKEEKENLEFDNNGDENNLTYSRFKKILKDSIDNEKYFSFC